MRRHGLGIQSTTFSEEEKLIEELSGFTEISIKTDALKLCRRLLGLKRISPDGFFEVMRVIGMFGGKKRWAPRLEAALARQSARVRRALQGTMLCFYAGFDDWKNALRFASMRHDLLPHEIAFSIEAFARAGRVREVRRLGKRIERWVEQIDSNRRLRHAEYELGYLLYGLGFYKIQECYTQNWYFREVAREDAVGHWSAVSPSHPYGATAGYDAIDLFLCIALEKVNGRIRWVEELRDGKRDSTALSLPGNQEALYGQMLNHLNRCRQALERLVPEKRRKELGMDRPSPAD